jgi:hypothetical protein
MYLCNSLILLNAPLLIPHLGPKSCPITNPLQTYS